MSCLHLARSLAVSLASFQSTPSVSRSSFSVSCHVLFGLPTLILPPSGLHIMARLADLVFGSRGMCPTNRLLVVATVSYSAACPHCTITSIWDVVNQQVNYHTLMTCHTWVLLADMWSILPCYPLSGLYHRLLLAEVIDFHLVDLSPLWSRSNSVKTYSCWFVVAL